MNLVSRQSPCRSTKDYGYLVIRNSVCETDCEELMYKMFDFIVNQPRIKSLQLSSIVPSKIESTDLYYYKKSWLPAFVDGTLTEMMFQQPNAFDHIYDIMENVKEKFIELYSVNGCSNELYTYTPVPIIRTPFSGQLQVHTEKYISEQLYTGYLALTPQFKTISSHKFSTQSNITFHDSLALKCVDVWLNRGDVIIYDEHLPKAYHQIKEKRLDCGLIFGWSPFKHSANQYYNFRPFHRYPRIYSHDEKSWNRYLSRIPRRLRADYSSV